MSWIAAVVACLAYGVASVLQSVGARRTADVAGLTGVALILVQLPYLIGLGLDALAFVANVLALQRLPLFLVQAVITASVGVTALVAHWRGARLDRRGWVSLAVLGAGLVLLSVSASTDRPVALGSAVAWAILAASVLPAMVGLIGLRLPDRPAALVLAVAAGLGWTGVAVASRGLGADALGPALLADPLTWAVVVQGLIGVVFFALALQRGAVTTVTAVTFVLEMVVPSGLGLWLFDDTVAHGLGPLALAGFGLAVVGTLSLSRFAE